MAWMIITIIGGLLLLWAGAESLVRGSAAVAARFRILSLVIGFTIVAFGTSTPEFVVSLRAAIDGLGAVALGNVIGSNICNIGLILGISTLIRPLSVQPWQELALVASGLFILVPR